MLLKLPLLFASLTLAARAEVASPPLSHDTANSGGWIREFRSKPLRRSSRILLTAAPSATPGVSMSYIPFFMK